LIESCTAGKDTKGYGLGVSQGPWTNKDFCDMHDATNSIDNLLDSCSAYCGKNNIPLLIGVPTSYGVSQQDMDRVCMGGETVHGQPTGLLGEFDKDRMAECKERSEAIEEIKEKMAHLVAAVDAMKLEQIRFRAALQAKMEEFNAGISSPTFELQMKATSDKIGLFTEFLQAEMKDTLFANGEDRARMLKSVETIGDMGVQLRETMAKKMPLLEDYAVRCGHPVLATSELGSGKYLLDLCFQNKDLCLDDPDSQHVGCCCGAVPAAGSFTIPAQPDGRRLQEQASASHPIDMCAQAGHFGKERADFLKGEINQTEVGRQLLAGFDTKMLLQYPEFYGRCANSGRRLMEDPRAVLEHAAMAAASALGIKHKAKVPKLNCEPLSGEFKGSDGSKEPMQTAFWSQSEVDTCDMLENPDGTKMKTQDLANVCAEFCGTESVPLLVGTVAFGFNKTAIDSICIDSSTLKTDEVSMKQCLKEAAAMNVVETKVAAAAASLMSLESTKLFYEASVRAMIPEMKAIIKSESQSKMRYARVGEKVDALQDVLNETLTSVTGNSAAAMSLHTALSDLTEKAQDLHETLKVAMVEFKHFIQDCDEIFTGKGASEEYMLDICSQTSLQCVEEDISRHVGCCCGYFPLLSVGKSSMSLTQTIPGIMASELSDVDGKARVANVEYPDKKEEKEAEVPEKKEEEEEPSKPHRRLEAEAQKKKAKEVKPEADFSICGSAYKEAMPKVRKTEEKIRSLGQEGLLTRHLAEMAEKYPGYAFCEASLAAEAGEGMLGKIEGSVEYAVNAAEAGVAGAVAEVEAVVEAGKSKMGLSVAEVNLSESADSDSQSSMFTSIMGMWMMTVFMALGFLWACVSQLRRAPERGGLAEPMLDA